MVFQEGNSNRSAMERRMRTILRGPQLKGEYRLLGSFLDQKDVLEKM
jgi:hypothetical protein